MSKFRGIVAPEQLEPGNIIQFKTQGTLMERRANPWSYGYIHHIEYDSKKNDEIVSIRVLPIIPAEKAQGIDFRYHVVNNENVGNALGLGQNQTWAIILAPQRIEPGSAHFGRQDGMVQRMGNIAGMDEQKQLLERIENIGGDEKLYYGQSGAPRMARPSAATWGLYAPVGVSRWRDDNEAQPVEPKRKYRRKADFEGLVIDMDLEKAVKFIGLDPEIAKLFEQPADGRTKKITTLRGIKELLESNGDRLSRYIPQQRALSANVELEELKGEEIHIGVVNGLAEPRQGASVKPVLDLQSAFELVTQRPEDLAKYNYLGPKLRQYAVQEITDAYNKRAVNKPPEQRIAEVKSAVKSAWAALMQGYAQFLTSQAVPEKLRGEDGQPLWKMVPKEP